MEDDKPQYEDEFAEEEESEEDQNEYVKDDFIDDDEDEEDKQQSKPKKKRKRHHDRVKAEDDDILDDDWDLINENNQKNKDKKKRLQKARDKEEERYEDEESDNEPVKKSIKEPDEFIEGSHSHVANIGVANEQLDAYNQIFHDSESDEEMEEEKKVEEEIIHTKKRLEEELGLVTNEEWRTEVARVDIPERLYIRLKGRLEPSEHELEEEAKWIYTTKKHWKKHQAGEERIIESITSVLKHFRKNYFDIPFISTYRCYLFQQELEPSDFYEIYEMDLEWNNFLKTKRSIIEKVQEVRAELEDPKMIDDSLTLSTSNNHLYDILQYVNFHKNLMPKFKTQKSRQKDLRRTNYAEIMELKIDKFAKEIALRPCDFAKNLRANSLIVKIKRMPTSPSLMAESYRTDKVSLVLDVLVRACSFVADEIAVHPVIRKCVTEKYMQGIKLSTKPTEKGEKELDVFHPSYRTKRLKIVPLEKFQDDLWIDIIECKEKGLIEVVFEHEEVLKEIIEWMKSLYYEVYPGDRYEKEWKTFYDEIIERVVGIVLKPDLEKRASQDLKERAWDYIISQMKDTFCKNFLMVPPHLFQKKPCNVVALVITTTASNTLTAVHVSEDGEVKSHLIFNYICIPYADRNQPDSFKADISRLENFIIDSRAGLVVIGAN